MSALTDRRRVIELNDEGAGGPGKIDRQLLAVLGGKRAGRIMHRRARCVLFEACGREGAAAYLRECANELEAEDEARPDDLGCRCHQVYRYGQRKRKERVAAICKSFIAATCAIMKGRKQRKVEPTRRARQREEQGLDAMDSGYATQLTAPAKRQQLVHHPYISQRNPDP